MRHTDPMLGNDRETNNETTLAGRQQISNNQTTEQQQRYGVFCAVCAEML
jgi:hypothetical protein